LSSTIYRISRTTDRADDLIVLELRRRGLPFQRFNIDRFPSLSTLSFDPRSGFLSFGDVDASDLLSGEAKVWTRGLRFNPHARDAAGQYILDETADLLSGIFSCSPSSAWASHPNAIANASYKAKQLYMAARLGFQLPSTMMTNDANSARSHLSKNPKSISKPITGRLITLSGQDAAVFTAPLELSQLTNKGPIAPFCAQERLYGFDVRVTIIGDHCFAVAIKTKSDRPDWRQANSDEVEYEIITLPTKQRMMAVNLVKAFDLKYGAIDLFYSKGSYYFLELNPGGQWGWLEHFCDLPLTSTIVDELLVKG
jgi:hypothetical protein